MKSQEDDGTKQSEIATTAVAGATTNIQNNYLWKKLREKRDHNEQFMPEYGQYPSHIDPRKR